MEGRFSVKLETQYDITRPKYMLLDKETNKVAGNMTKKWIKEIYNGGTLGSYSWDDLFYWRMCDNRELPIEAFLLLN